MNVPKLRFKEFDGEWEEKDFEELLEAKDGIRRGPFGSALKKEFFVPESDYVVYEQQNAIYDKYTTRYNITKDKYEELIKFSLNAGDFIMSGAGTIGRISKVPKGIKKGVFNQALIRFRINSEITDSEYFLQFMRAEKMQRNLTGANPGSAITNLVPMSELKKWSIITPNIKEQQKISAFLNLLDKKIQLQQQKIDLLQEQKKGFLQKMFPKAGETQPEIRFEGFTENWKPHKLSDGMIEYTERVFIEDEKLYKQISVKNIGEITIRGEKIGSEIGRKRQARVNLDEHPYTLIFTRQTVEQGGIGFAPKQTNGAIVTENMPTIEVDVRIFDKDYLLALFKTSLWYRDIILFNVEGGTAQVAIHEDNILSSETVFPSIEEQKNIGAFFKNLNKKIEVEQKKIELLQKQKQGFMQQMFI